MGYVTKEQIARAREIDVLDYVLRYERDNVRIVGKSYRMKDHPSIEIMPGRWRWYSHGMRGRTALDYLTDVRGYGLVDAVCKLIGESPSEHGDKTVSKRKANTPVQSVEQKAQSPPEPLPFSLPRHYKNNSRVIAYLQSRGIDKELVQDCIRRGVLYESAGFHNAVFLGRDERGKTRYGAFRSTTSGFKRDADGSDKRYGFVLTPNEPDSREIAAFESPIDALSHSTLCKQGFIEPFNGWRLSLGGTSVWALERFLENHPEVTRCLICTDNDEAGDKLVAKIAALPDIVSARSPPSAGKDWNDTLMTMQKAERIRGRERAGGEQCR